jgi:hypothetical protein
VSLRVLGAGGTVVAGVVVGVGVGVVEGTVELPLLTDPLGLELLLELDDPLALFEEVPAGVELVELPPWAPLELFFTCWVNGLRSCPVSFALLGVGVTLTAGRAGTGALDEPAGGIWATGTPPLPLLERTMGTATRATISNRATGHRRFSRRSAMRSWITVMV